MPACKRPHIADLLPQTGLMILLSDVLWHRGDETACAVEIDDQKLLQDSTGDVPAWMGLEYMAQCVAAHAGLVARAAGRPPQIGFLLGCRWVDFYIDRYRPGQTLEVRARRVWGGVAGMVQFECSIRDAATNAPVADGRLNFYLPSGDFPGGRL